MRLGVLSDIHANRVALDAVFEDMPRVDGLVCAGDVVGYNPWPAECVAEVRERAIPTVQGNHDRAASTGSAFGFNSMARAGVDYTREQLDAESIEWLGTLPTERTVADGRVKVVHGHPDDPDHYTRPHEFAPDLLGEEDVLVMGHTHVQHHEVYDEGIVLNPGSVGQPRDGDERAAYAVLDLDAMEVEERRVDYSIRSVVDAVREAGLPERIGTRLLDGK
ncbi:phosphoesterase, MJ0936 family [Halogranum rubrum]|uniref:Phosphoesterase n=1 Tax=Halogranum rubrum TaxID=553466 RepID=A0A1I4HBS4_9EURY|nr:metallophosphoesterase family protein [Halogranum rubrum]SFL39615.1 phosphoesterase, MJ0936 family [Halogranum rubrum]